MKPKATLRSLLIVASSALLASVNTASAAEYWWNQNGTSSGWGADGTWNTTNAFFSTTDSDTTTAAAATTTTADTLNFGNSTVGFSTFRSITVSGTQNIGTINIGSSNTQGVALTGNGSTLNFAASGTITNNGSGELFVTKITGAATRLDLNATGGGITLFGANTHSGITYVNTGTVTANENSVFGIGGTDASRTVVASGARINFNNTPRTYTERFEIAGAGVGGSTGALANSQTSTNLNGLVSLSDAATIYSSAGTLTLGGGISLGSNALTFNVAGGTQTVQTTGISGTDGAVAKSGGGVLNLNIGSSYTGGTTVSAGTLNIGNTSALGSISGQLTVDGGALNMAGNSITVGNLTGSGGIISGTSGTRTLTIGQGNTGGGNFQGAINNGTGTTALTKTGSGTITLSGANGYTGATKVSGGTLVVNNTIASSATTVETTGVLTGTGVLGSSLTVKSTGVVNAGTVGSINTSASVTGATNFESGSIFSWDLSADGATGDKLTTGSVTGSGATFRILLANGTVNDSFFNIDRPDFFADTNIISSASDLTALFSSVEVYSALTNTAANISSRGSFSLTSNGVSWTAVPEPTSALAGLLLTAGLLRRRRSSSSAQVPQRP